LSVEKSHSYRDMLAPHQEEIISLTENYSDRSLARRFTKGEATARTYLDKLTDHYIAQFVRPYIEKQMNQCLELVRRHMVPVFLRETKNVVYKEDFICIAQEPAEVVFNFIKLKDETRYYQNISHLGQSMHLTGTGGIILTDSPCWLLLNRTLYHFKQKVDGRKLSIFFNKEFITVPPVHEKRYYSTFVKKCIRDFPVLAQGFPVRHQQPEKHPMLTLEMDLEGLPSLFLQFKYGNQILKSRQGQIKIVRFSQEEGTYAFDFFYRDLNWETETVSFLESLGLKNVYENTFQIDSEVSPHRVVNWLNEHSATLKERNFLLSQEIENIIYFTDQMEMVMRAEEKNDWFEVYAMARFGNDFEIPVVQLRKHLLEGIREYRLPDGRIAVLPESWFADFSDLLTFGQREKDMIRVRRWHGSLLSALSISGFDGGKRLTEAGDLPPDTAPPDPPDGLLAQLRSYQLEGFRWLDHLRRKHLGGCLADDMGLGKTLQALTLLLNYIGKTTKSIAAAPPAQGGQLDLFNPVAEQSGAGKPSLIIMPASLIHNWQAEIRKFIPHIGYLTYTGSQRHELLPQVQYAHLVLTTYGTIRNDFDALSKFDFGYIILDESQVIKNPASKTARVIFRLKSEHRVTLSGTPIENSLSDLWSQMHFLNPGLLGEHAFFKRFFATPIQKHDDRAKQEKLQQLIRPFILRRTKREVEKELPELSQEYIYCEMTPQQEQVYQQEKTRIRNFILDNIEKQGPAKSAIIVLRALTRLRQMASHPVLTDKEYQAGSGKFDEVVRNIETLIAEGHKVLVFSSFVKHLRIFTDYFDTQKIGYSLLTGSTRDRAAAIRSFEEEEQQRNIFFISLKAGGTGLNLTSAEYVFLLDPWWNPQAELQAISRAHRIGQTHPVMAYRFITVGTVEEKIMLLQQKKSKLADIFINTNNPLKEMNVDNIRELIS
ncbi:MAG: SNF2-related protein, partial [Bacteroidales bacterium]|nr:SNF2-related protein [Bacteroidales bacterium]